MPERLLIMALLLGALWLVRRSLAPVPLRENADGKARVSRCGGCQGCAEDPARDCSQDGRP